MKIYDCFMYFNEDLLTDLRLNILDNYVTKFIITEAEYTHNGTKKKLNFDINNFSKFKNKIEYIVVNKEPPNIKQLSENDSSDERGRKLIFNGYSRDIYQRNALSNGLKDLDDDDLIIISDLDEIPNLENIDLKKIENEILVFKQKIFYYKLNLCYDKFPWFGSKACKKKKFLSPQWLREIKAKKYSKLRLDTFFSKKKNTNIKIIDNGGWHYTYMKSAKEIFYKLSNFAHHYEFEESGLQIKDIENFILKKKIIYDYNVDQRGYKWSGKESLNRISDTELPSYVKLSLIKYKNWLD
jgi:beta-1,4-mannosyl-glycoprotein beta-1,4-N-acetylglucosaminyltransferase